MSARGGAQFVPMGTAWFKVRNVITLSHLRHEIIRILFQVSFWLSLFVADLQNSRFNRVECTFSTIPTCVYLPVGVSFLSVYLRIRHFWCTAGTSPDCCSFLHFTYSFGSFVLFSLQAIYFVLLLLGSVFPHIITIICISKKINGICITMKKLSHSLTVRKMLKLMLYITIKPVQ